ncbi:DUF159 family protein [Paracoccus contaminans]|uniref:Abasic site processing protein n=2 Tax=Paracoccus contaminans TaxID=1945662 RepID=A0A1W6D1B2_9RHOB|nr:DUF159 family protein [Paracoccus contaminans]
MCNLYSNKLPRDFMATVFQAADRLGNYPAAEEVYPDREAVIVRNGAEGRELVRARWGLPSPPAVLKTARDPGVTNVRNTASPHWRRWLGPEHRCLVPLSAFSEPGRDEQGKHVPVWFALTGGQPAAFAGIEVRGWRSVRKVRDGETTDDLFAFLTTQANAEVAEIHPKAMPVILTEPEHWNTWLRAPWAEAQALCRPLPDGSLRRL